MKIRELWCALIHFGHTPGPTHHRVGGRTVRACIHCDKILFEEFSRSVAAAKERQLYGHRRR